MGLVREKEKRKLLLKRTYFLIALIASTLVYTFSNFHEGVKATIVSSITPDGNLNDWSSVTTTITDPDEPPSCLTDPFDTKMVWIANQQPTAGGNYYIYFRWDRYGTTPASASLEIPIDTNGDMIQDYFIWLDVDSAGGGKMNVSYALYQGSPSTANKNNPVPGTSESYIGPSGQTSSFEARVLASKLGLLGGGIIILTMRTRASSSFQSEIMDCVNPTAPCACAPEYWIIYDTGDGSATTTTTTVPTVTVTATTTTTATTLTPTQTVTTPITVTPTVTVTATTTGTEVTVTPTLTVTPTITVTTTISTSQITETNTVTYTPTVTATPTITLTTSITTAPTTITATPTITFTATITFTPTITLTFPTTTATPPPPPSKPPLYPVGGILTPVNKLVILTPYLALIGLAAIAVILVKKRKR